MPRARERAPVPSATLTRACRGIGLLRVPGGGYAIWTCDGQRGICDLPTMKLATGLWIWGSLLVAARTVQPGASQSGGSPSVRAGKALLQLLNVRPPGRDSFGRTPAFPIVPPPHQTTSFSFGRADHPFEARLSRVLGHLSLSLSASPTRPFRGVRACLCFLLYTRLLALQSQGSCHGFLVPFRVSTPTQIKAVFPMLLRGKDLSLNRRASLALSAPPGQREDALGSLRLGIRRTSRGERRTVGEGCLGGSFLRCVICTCVYCGRTPHSQCLGSCRVNPD